MSEKRPRILYHFTRLDSAKKILTSMQLRLGNFENANDPTENLIHIYNMSSNPSEYGISRRMRELRFLSFSYDPNERDCINMQPMWNHYGDKWEGVCIEVDLGKFMDENRYIIEKYGIVDDKIEYGMAGRTLVPEVLFLTSTKGKSSSAERTFSDWMIYEDNWRRRFFCKDDSWSYEQEYRFLALKDYSDEIFLSIQNSLKRVILGLGFDLDAEENKNFINSVGIGKVYRSRVFLDKIITENVSDYYEEVRRLRNCIEKRKQCGR